MWWFNPQERGGILRGTGDTKQHVARVQYLSQDDAVNVGDAIVTSGLGKRFPSGIMIGRVTRVNRREFGLHQEVEIRPTVDFSRLDHVLIVTSGPRSEWATVPGYP